MTNRICALNGSRILSLKFRSLMHNRKFRLKTNNSYRFDELKESLIRMKFRLLQIKAVVSKINDVPINLLHVDVVHIQLSRRWPTHTALSCTWRRCSSFTNGRPYFPTSALPAGHHWFALLDFEAPRAQLVSKASGAKWTSHQNTIFRTPLVAPFLLDR